VSLTNHKKDDNTKNDTHRLNTKISEAMNESKDTDVSVTKVQQALEAVNTRKQEIIQQSLKAASVIQNSSLLYVKS